MAAKRLIAGVLALAACGGPPTGPTIQVIRGSGRSFSDFQQDQAACRAFAASQLDAPARALGLAAVGPADFGALGIRGGTPIGVGGSENRAVTAANAFAATQQSGPQQRYDDAFGLCMFARGNQLPGYGPLAVLQPASAAPSSVVQAVQAELNRLGYMAGPADGVAGPQTVAAISYFERANGLPVDNAASPGLLERLRRMP